MKKEIKEKIIKAWAIIDNKENLHCFWEDTGKFSIYCGENRAKEWISKWGQGRFKVVPCEIRLKNK